MTLQPDFEKYTRLRQEYVDLIVAAEILSTDMREVMGDDIPVILSFDKLAKRIRRLERVVPPILNELLGDDD